MAFARISGTVFKNDGNTKGIFIISIDKRRFGYKKDFFSHSVKMKEKKIDKKIEFKKTIIIRAKVGEKMSEVDLNGMVYVAVFKPSNSFRTYILTLPLLNGAMKLKVEGTLKLVKAYSSTLSFSEVSNLISGDMKHRKEIVSIGYYREMDMKRTVSALKLDVSGFVGLR